MKKYELVSIDIASGIVHRLDTEFNTYTEVNDFMEDLNAILTGALVEPVGEFGNERFYKLSDVKDLELRKLFIVCHAGESVKVRDFVRMGLDEYADKWQEF